MIRIEIKASPEVLEPQLDVRKSKIVLSANLDLKTIEAITKISFLQLIETKEKMDLPYILAFVEHREGKVQFYDALALHKLRKAHRLKEICPDRIRRVHYYSIQSPKDPFPQFIGTIDKRSVSKMEEIDYILASNQIDSPEGKYTLGKYYERGRGVEVDIEKAYKLYELSAYEGNVSAQLKMAEKFAQGIDEDAPDDQKAFSYYKLAAENGKREAQYQLGVCYAVGLGTEMDHEKAFKCYKDAAKSQCDYAYLALGHCYRLGHGVDSDMTMAVKYFKKSAKKGNVYAISCLATCYRAGQGIEKNGEKAFLLYRLATKAGLICAECNLGRCYEKGIGVKANFGKAFLHYQNAANTGLPSALYRLGRCYEYGKGVDKDLSLALLWYEKAAAAEIPSALYKLGRYYEHGMGGVEQNRYTSHGYYQKASCLGSQRALGKIDRIEIGWFQNTTEQETIATSCEETFI